jgi:hypothetical protein
VSAPESKRARRVAAPSPSEGQTEKRKQEGEEAARRGDRAVGCATDGRPDWRACWLCSFALLVSPSGREDCDCGCRKEKRQTPK